MVYFSKYLKENEELIAVVKGHPLVYFKPALIAIILLLLPFFLMFLLFKWETIGLIVFFVLVAIGILAVIKLMVIWTCNACLITDKRVVLLKQYGFFEKQVSEAELGEITGVSFRIKGLFESIFRYGSIRLQLTESIKPMIISKVTKPREIQELIQKLKANL